MRPRSKLLGLLSGWVLKFVREREHIVMKRQNEDGTETPLVMPNHTSIKGVT
jgi:hypothetical protein